MYHLDEKPGVYEKKAIFAPEKEKTMKEAIVLFIGGGAGSLLRYGAQVLLHERIHPYSFPWSTFSVNLIGSFLIGLFYALAERYHLSAETRLALTTGLCGGFTTFSTFSHDCLQMLRQGYVGPFLLYALVSLVLGIIAVWAGGTLGNPS